MTFFSSWAAGSAAARIGMSGAADDGAGRVFVVVWVTEVVVDVVIIDPIGGLALSLAVSSKNLELFLPQYLHPAWSLEWQV